MSNALVVLERQLQPLAPRFADVLPATVKPDRLIRTVMMSAERLPALLDCDRQSLFNAALSAAVLGLEVDGVTGQAYLIPFKGKAQLVVGYKGYNTIAARAGITITGAVVRDGDHFEYELGSNANVKHVPALNNKGPIIAAWAAATALGRPPVVSVLGIDDLMAVKAKSPGARRGDSPWNDPAIGFPAMCEKTAKRRLARSLPLNMMQLAARMDEAVDEQGKPAWVRDDQNVIVEGEIVQPSETPTAEALIGNRASVPTKGSPAQKNPAASVGAEHSDLHAAGPQFDVGHLEMMAREAAMRGEDMFNTFYAGCNKEQKAHLRSIKSDLVALYPKQDALS